MNLAETLIKRSKNLFDNSNEDVNSSDGVENEDDWGIGW